MARRDSIALYTSPKGLQWRRLSEPSSTNQVLKNNVTFDVRSRDVPKAFRRYSFSALEDYRKGKRLDTVFHKSGTPLDRPDLTPLEIRNQVDQLLQKNGYKEREREKVSQLRRYSLNMDKDAVNLLGDGIRRNSFGAYVPAAATAVTNARNNGRIVKSKNQQLQARTGEDEPDEVFRHDPLAYSPKRDTPAGSVRTNACENINQPTESNRLEVRKTQQDNEVDVIKMPETEDIDHHLDLKKSLWKGRCRRDSLAKFRNRVVDALRAYVETDTEYWRRCRSMSTDDGSTRHPKCKYRLRENGLIASELANFTKIDIDTSVNKLEHYESNDAWQNISTDQPTSEAPAPDKAEVLHNLLKRRRKSSLFSEHDFDRKTLLQRSLSSFSDRNSQIGSPDLNFSQPFSFQKSFGRQQSRTEGLSGSEAYLAHQRAQLMRRSSLEKRRWSQTPSEGFELIGTTALHGTPGYKGRLMLLTARTVRFHDEFHAEN
ncbi:hypothetical protein ElyMa_001456300 [Elysia marginata]|uniref:Uncharacterized protein n=1 Tax=Elysia marginata TaxID=1093978 RepID=A0AAV4J387_9GAST|nr:hypothetical protein ElyMa_001456300 [Elysia marginata]